MVAPACELTAAGSVSSKVNEEQQHLALTIDLGYTAGDWCNAGDLDFELVYKLQEHADWMPWNLTEDDIAALMDKKAVIITDSIPEQDYNASYKFTVNYKNSTIGQDDVTEEGNGVFEHLETCRPVIPEDSVVINSLEQSETKDYTLDLDFSYEFAGTGLQNCVDLQAWYKIKKDDELIKD